MKIQKSYSWAICLIVVAVMLAVPLSGLSQAEEEGSAPGKSRAEIYAEMKSMLGLVPIFFKSIPDSTLELEWALMKRVQMEPGPIPNKYRELIGIAVSAATKCEYCGIFHTEMARLNGATDEEIEDALHYTKSTTGWSTYINGSQVDLDVFRGEVKAMVEYIRKASASAGKEDKQ
jgi:AhpD family alkylhydroperoxidase